MRYPYLLIASIVLLFCGCSNDSDSPSNSTFEFHYNWGDNGKYDGFYTVGNFSFI